MEEGLQALREKARTAQEDAAAASVRTAELSRELTAAANRVGELESALSKAGAEAAALSKEVGQLRKKANDAEGNLEIERRESEKLREGEGAQGGGGH